MISFRTLTLATVLAVSVSTVVFASSYQCEAVPKDKWKTVEEAHAAMAAEGYNVRKIEVEGGCYEIYATKNGGRFEAFVQPFSLEIVKLKKR